MKPFLSVIGALLLASCGPLNSDSPAKAGYSLVSEAFSGSASAQPVITPELAAAGEGGILFVTLRQQGALLPMTKVGARQGVETWRSATGITLTLEDGLVVATRGLGYDLMGVDAIGTLDAIAAGSGNSNREHSFLTSLDQIDGIELTCEVSGGDSEEVELPRGARTLVRFDEECAGSRLAFKNQYWLDTDGNIVRSIQALSPVLGFVLLERG